MYWLAPFFIACHASEGITKLVAMRQKQMKSEDGIIRFDSSEYKHYVVLQPRVYSVFVMLTGPTRTFPELQVFDDSFSMVSKSYLSGYVDDDRPIFFVVVNAYTHRDVSLLHDVKTMPFIAHIGLDKWMDKTDGDTFEFRKGDTFSPSPHTSFVTLLNWANGFTNVEVKVHVPESDKLMYWLLIAWIVTAGSVSIVLGVRLCRENSMILVVFACIVHSIAISGFIANILSPGGLQWGPSNQPFFRPGQRSQFIREAVLVAVVTFAPAMLLLFIINARDFMTGGISDWRPIQVGCVLLALAASQGLLLCFKIKSMWYDDPPFFAFPHMKTGPIHHDQGNTILD